MRPFQAIFFKVQEANTVNLLTTNDILLQPSHPFKIAALIFQARPDGMTPALGEECFLQELT
jgi:hypothetical protein